jgi:uncharacterized membrane protein
MSFIAHYFAIAVPLLIADAIWLTTAASFYREALGPLMAREIKWAPAALFYLAYPVGLVIFALQPALQANAGIGKAALLGGLFGLFCYGTYDLVNQATLEGWPLRLTLVDMTWGTVLSATTTAFAYWFLSR